MAVEVQIVSTLDNDQTIAGFVETEQAAAKTATSIEGASEATLSFQQKLRGLKKEQDQLTLDERIAAVKDVFDGAAPSVDKLTAEIKEYQSIALAAGRTTPIGREFLEKAAAAKDQITDLQNETKRLSDDNRNLAAAIQGIGVGVSAFAGVAAGAALFGDRNEELQKLLIKVTAAQTLLNSVQQIQVALQKESALRLAISNRAQTANAIIAKGQAAATGLLSAATAAYSVVVGGTTGVLKVFRIALASTGIGAIVIGIGLLIANFDTISEAVVGAVKQFFNLRNVLLLLLGPIGLLIIAYETFFGATEDQRTAEERLAEQRKQASLALAQQTQQRIDDIKREQKAFVDAKENENEALETQIKIRENNGDASDEQRLTILENNKAIVESELDAVQQIIDAKILQFETEAKLRGQTEEELAALLKAQGVDVEQLRADADELVSDLQLQVELSESEITKFKREENEKRTNNAKKAADEQKKIDEALLKRRIAAIAQLDALEIKAIVDQQEREEAALQFSFEQRIANLNEAIPEEQALILALEQQFLTDLQKLRDKFAEEEKAKAFQDAQELDDLRIQILEGRRVSELEQFTVDREVATLRFQEDLENLRFELETKEITEEEFRLREELLRQEHQNTLTEIEEEGSQARIDAALEEADKKIGQVQHFADSAAQINSLANQIQDNLLKEGEELSLKQQKRRFQRDKAFNIASALINGASAVVKGIATFGPPPSPLGIAAIASAGIITALQVAAIASQKLNPSGGGGGGGATAGGGAGGFTPTAATGGGTTPNIPTTPTGGTNESGEEIFNQGGQQNTTPQTIQAFVIPGKLTTAQEAAVLIEEQSTLYSHRRQRERKY